VLTCYLVVKVPVDGELGLHLPLEEGIVELLVVDVNLAHLGTHLLPHLGLHGLGIFLQAEEGGEIQSLPRVRITPEPGTNERIGSASMMEHKKWFPI
jgi:hypothetical protein